MLLSVLFKSAQLFSVFLLPYFSSGIINNIQKHLLTGCYPPVTIKSVVYGCEGVGQKRDKTIKVNPGAQNKL